MNPLLRVDGDELWQVAGWTMVHFTWLGAVVGVVAASFGVVLRRASPNARYLAAAISLSLLAVLPIAIATWLVGISPPFQGGARGEFFRLGEDTPHASVSHNPAEHMDSVAELNLHTAAPTDLTLTLPADVVARDDTFEPSPGPSLGGRRIALAVIESCVPYLPWIWFVGTPVTLLLLATGIVGSERLRRASEPVAVGPIAEMGAQLRKTLRIGRRVAIAVCERVAAPVLVGILRPLILLPPAALTGWSPTELEMVLLHELAHVRRWDNLVNLLQRLVESLLFFHPAVWLVSSWMRREREACCDAVVVRHTNRRRAYAELLVSLASQQSEAGRSSRRLLRAIRRRGSARPGSLASAMAAGPLRNRIRYILQLEDDAMLVTGKSFAMVLGGLLTAATLAVLYLPTRGQAEESATVATENTQESKENAESEEVVEVAGENEIQIDSPIDQVVLDAEDDWLLGEYFIASQKERKIAQRAWKELGIKAVPLTEAELKEVRRGGFRGGLKLIGLEEVMNTQGPLILTHIQSKRLATGVGDFAALERALDALASQPPDELLVLQGTKPRGGIFQYSMRRPQEKSAQSTVTAPPDADGQSESEPVNSADLERSWRVQVEQGPVGNENVLVVRGSKDDVNAFIKTQTEAGENRETQNERRLLGEFSLGPDYPQNLLSVVDEARAKNLYVDIEYGEDKVKLIAVPEPREADWPAMLGDSPRKDRVIADKAWERLGLKVVPASALEQFEYHTRQMGGPIKIIGGNVPKGLPLPAFLRQVGENSLVSYADLHIWLLHQDNKRPSPVKVYAIANGHEYLFDAEPVEEERLGLALAEPKSKFPSLEDQKLADLAWRMLQLELEPAGDEDLKSVRALGYQGGVTVTGTMQEDSRRRGSNEIQRGDILVGLHVWPTTSLKDVAEILKRDDLADLNPLKFYVLRGGNVIVTGRISVRTPATQASGDGPRMDAATFGTVGKTSPERTAEPRAANNSRVNPPAVASENEIKVLQDHIKTLQSQFERIDALYKTGARGGSVDNRALAAFELAAAKGELALIQGRHDQAIEGFKEARARAEEALKAFSAAYETGGVTYDVVVLASKNLANIKRRIIQLEQRRASSNRAAAAATSGAPESGEPRNTRYEDGVMIVGESQEALDQFMRLASSAPRSGDSIGVLKRIVDREKQKYERLAELAKNEQVSTIEVETQKADYEISMERLRQAQRALQYHKAEVAMAAADYEAALEASKQQPGAVSQSELRKLQLKVQAAEARFRELAE
jgi:hypothetical protein